MKHIVASMMASAILPVPTHGMAQVCEIDNLRYDQVQAIGTHNSYKIEVDHGVDHALRIFDYREDQRFDARQLAYRLSYQHPPLDVQLDVGVRVLEIDIYDDPEGGAFARPGGFAAMAALNLEPNTPYDPHGLMLAPGLKVLHVPDWDFLSNCPTLQLCLKTLDDWSLRHPEHFPIMVRIEAKERMVPAIGDTYAPATVRRFDQPAFDRLEDEIASVLGADRIYARHAYGGDWPLINQLRGRFIFVLSGESDVGTRYQAAMRGRPRTFFTFAEADGLTPILNLAQADEGAREGNAGAIIYTRSETTETREARENDTAAREIAFASAANIIWTDYAIPDARFSEYRVRFPQGTHPLESAYVRPHPIRTRAACAPPVSGR